MAVLAFMLVSAIIQAAAFAAFAGLLKGTNGAPPFIAGVAAFVVWCALFWSSLAVMAKRFHDTDRSGWNFFWSFLPIIGPILLLYWLGFERGTNGSNRFGEDPLAGSNYTPVKSSLLRTLLIVIAVLAVAAVLMGGTFAGIMTYLKHSDSYLASEAYIKQSPEVKEAVGEVKSLGSFPSGSFNVVNGHGKATYTIKVIGTYGTANSWIDLSKEPNTPWKVESFSVLRDDTVPAVQE